MNNFNIDLVINQDGKIVTTSRIVAEKFGKRHDHVLRAIKNLDCSQEFAHLNFGECSYINDNNREMPEYTITRDGFSFLAMGFTGKKAAKFKEDYITAFNRMEAEMVEPKQLSTVEMFELALKTAKENEQLKKTISIQEPKVQLYDKVMDDGKLYSMSQVAKVLELGIGRNKLYQKLRELGLLYQHSNEPQQRFMESGLFKVKYAWIESKEMKVPTTKVTNKGLAYIAKLLGVTIPSNNSVKFLN